MHFKIENSNEKAFGGKFIVLGSNLGKFCWLFQIQIDLKLYWQYLILQGYGSITRC